MEQLKNIEMLTDKIRFKWMKQYRVISENIVLCVSLRHGVLIEALSVEDRGEGICFCVYVYNVQPGVEIDYSTGESRITKG